MFHFDPKRHIFLPTSLVAELALSTCPNEVAQLILQAIPAVENSFNLVDCSFGTLIISSKMLKLVLA